MMLVANLSQAPMIFALTCNSVSSSVPSLAITPVGSKQLEAYKNCEGSLTYRVATVSCLNFCMQFFDVRF